MTTSQFATAIGIHPQTLRRHTRTGLIPCSRTPGNHRRFNLVASNDEKLRIGYARVSSHDQKEDLARQKNDIQEKAAPDRVISDIGSGMNYNKPGFKQLVALVLQGKVGEIILTHKDRLLRFGSEIIFMICKTFHVKITILYPEELIEPTERFCKDLVEIMTVFCSKIYGQRSHKHRKSKLANQDAQLCSGS